MNDIPSDFYSDYSGQPFETCLDCSEPLLIGEQPYLVMKHIVAQETVFEMAMCLTCAAALQQEYSEESRRAIERWVTEQAPMEGSFFDPSDSDGGPVEREFDLPPTDPLSSLERCQFCHTPRSNAHRYSIAALCAGQSLLATPFPRRMIAFPYMVCEECNGDVSEMISQQTRDRWNRFVEDHFDGPPGIMVDPVDSDLMFV